MHSQRSSVAVLALVYGVLFPFFSLGNLAPFESAEWTPTRRALGHESVSVLVGIRAEDESLLEKAFWEISDPRHSSYGKHLSRDEADNLTKPSTAALRDAKYWMSSFTRSKLTFSPSTNILRVVAAVGEMENTFQTEIHEFKHENREGRLLRALTALKIPAHLKEVITFVSLNTKPIRLNPRVYEMDEPKIRPSDGERKFMKEGAATPQFLRDLYNIPDSAVVTNPNNSQAVAEFYDECWSENDLKEFYRTFNLSHPKLVEKGNRANDPYKASNEASLDLQYITAMAPNATTTIWNMEGRNPFSSIDEPFLEWAEMVLAEEFPPLVFSMSYSDDEEHVFNANEEYARKFDDVTKKLGARGVSILFSSGDDGVAGQRPTILNLSEEERCLRHGPQWPSGSSYITSVGATMILDREHVEDFFKTKMEVPCSGIHGGLITTGGGFANKYGIPEYQRKAVERYLQTDDIPTAEGFFNKSGRGYPDISAYGAQYYTIVNGAVRRVAGTSASAPTVAAMVTLWNDRRLNEGKPPLGFLNPLLYLIGEIDPTAFNDVIIGSNGGGQGRSFGCDVSFHAAIGWDAASGLGTPNFQKLSDLTFNAENLSSDAVLTLGETTLGNKERGGQVVESKEGTVVDNLSLFMVSLGWVLFGVLLMVVGLNRVKSGPAMFSPLSETEPEDMEEARVEESREREN